MRKIIFRGRKNNPKPWIVDVWVYGYFSIHPKRMESVPYITDIRTLNMSEVIPETVGQFTGLTDKNGKEVYEGDIIQDNNGIGVIIWFQTAYGIASYAHGYNGLKSYTAVDSFYISESKEWTIIGNIHDNPELLTSK